ncbi:hypothetical protein FHP29_11930 [Nocardioides albidus]|uniref:DUF3137 domain-containing protein n=1 Tax=Nocardioides albidus TaxID=1517589 RepID=A0A5C4VUG6_9ACTN|nr:hypothetical protein [Nocardioides albidus]TNM39584.1 hypothetical protein FHP29_11930 [Nocardioides albidus]
MSALPLFMIVIFAIVLGGILVLFPIAIVTSYRKAAERREGLARFAHQREWEFRADDRALVDRFTGAPFGRGSGRYATNVIIGDHDGRPFTAFDYQYASTRGESNNQHFYSVVALNLGVQAPDLSVGPTTLLSGWVDGLTGRDIEIGDPAFDAHFTVHSPAPEFAADVLLSDVREVMRHHPGEAWRITGDSLLVIRSGRHVPADIDARLHMMDALLDRVPDRVWDRLRGEQPR